MVALFTTHKVVRDEGRMYNRDKIKRSVALAADLFFFGYITIGKRKTNE